MEGIVNFAQVPGAVPVSQADPVGKAEQTAEDRPAERRAAPRMDEYIPEEPRTPIGLYRTEPDENGEPRIIFDAPEDEAQGPEKAEKSPQVPGKSDSGKEEVCTANTDKVDREIERLKEGRDRLEREISNAEDVPGKRAELEKQLAQVESELRMKDNDAYRKQHSEFKRTFRTRNFLNRTDKVRQ